VVVGGGLVHEARNFGRLVEGFRGAKHRLSMSGEMDGMAFLEFRSGVTLVSAVAWRSDTPKFRDAWWYGIELSEHLSPAFPVIRQFRRRVAEGGEPPDLARFVDDICIG
jgi:hypothetical protein